MQGEDVPLSVPFRADLVDPGQASSDDQSSAADGIESPTATMAAFIKDTLDMEVGIVLFTFQPDMNMIIEIYHVLYYIFRTKCHPVALQGQKLL